MSDKTRNVWFITGAGRGMGADFARAVLAAGHALVATGRDSDARVQGPGTVERPADRQAGCHAGARMRRRGAVPRSSGSAASTCWSTTRRASTQGYFEELTPEQIERQLATSLIGPMNVTRAVLPVMRKQRSGHIISISSSAGLAAGFEFVTAYAASKFGLEGWMESLQAEVAPFGIHTTIVNPGFFRTELLDGAVDGLRRAVDRGLRRAPCAAARVLESPRMASNLATRRSSRAP